jgi:hypothetical protein
MTSKNELHLAYGLALVLFVVGVLSYAYTAFSAKPPEQPIRIMYKSVAGKVLYDHKTHADETGYGFSCFDCHHHPEDDESSWRACGDCHDLPVEKDLYPEACSECHDQDEIEDTEVPKKGDAFHSQCIGCHKEVEAGPEDCNSCHVL